MTHMMFTRYGHEVQLHQAIADLSWLWNAGNAKAGSLLGGHSYLSGLQGLFAETCSIPALPACPGSPLVAFPGLQGPASHLPPACDNIGAAALREQNGASNHERAARPAQQLSAPLLAPAVSHHNKGSVPQPSSLSGLTKSSAGDPSFENSVAAESSNATGPKRQQQPMPDAVRVIRHAGPDALYVASDQGWLHRLDLPSACAALPPKSVQVPRASQAESVSVQHSQHCALSCAGLSNEPSSASEQSPGAAPLQGHLDTAWTTIYNMQAGRQSPPLCMAVRPAEVATAGQHGSPVEASEEASKPATATKHFFQDCLHPGGDGGRPPLLAEHDLILIGERSGSLHFILVASRPSMRCSLESVRHEHHQDVSQCGQQNALLSSAEEIAHGSSALAAGISGYGRACAWAGHQGVPVAVVTWASALRPGAAVSGGHDGSIKLWDISLGSDGCLKVRQLFLARPSSALEVLCVHALVYGLLVGGGGGVSHCNTACEVPQHAAESPCTIFLAPERGQSLYTCG